MKALLLTLLVSGISTGTFSQTYFDTYPKEVSRAKEFIDRHHTLLDSTFKKHAVDKTTALAIVAPEAGMYAVWRDRMETTATEIFYAEMGTAYSDFSIGYFQMKPSFAEAIESYIVRLSLNEFTHLLPAPADEKSTRLNRVARLKSLRYQAAYLAAFISIWRALHPQPMEVITLATAYNAGFWKDERQLIAMAGRASFPRKVFGTKQFAYGDVALEYYKDLSQKDNTGK